LFSERRNLTAAKRFLSRALKRHAARNGLSSMAARPTVKRSCPAIRQTGCRTDHTGSSSRSGYDRSDT
jgi:transposase-like protein